eukprot:TRINITY_DN68078_c1_g1_i1.p1 TRINITY_DN68078_c1_g1~~TRINITY_DN68078_c1_g1_i1.p1  ORF type:complete len:117 (-),score=0.58 TRINITY_DN68078_c1_g1_i1:258-557(-)
MQVQDWRAVGTLCERIIAYDLICAVYNANRVPTISAAFGTLLGCDVGWVPEVFKASTVSQMIAATAVLDERLPMHAAYIMPIRCGLQSLQRAICATNKA